MRLVTNAGDNVLLLLLLLLRQRADGLLAPGKVVGAQVVGALGRGLAAALAHAALACRRSSRVESAKCRVRRGVAWVNDDDAPPP